MKIVFLGAPGTVTGSKYLVEAGATKLLVDCGLFQGYRHLRARNWTPLPFDPAILNAVILTHAQMDHSGYVPLLVKSGFAGHIYCTPATADLCAILLPDNGRFQEERTAHANEFGYSKHNPALPLYTRDDAKRSLKQLHRVPFNRKINLPDGLSIMLSTSGHILGSAFVTVEQGGRAVVFAGDIGRYGDEIMNAPSRITKADYLVIKSTYAKRVEHGADPKEQLAAIINRTYRRSGVLVAPAFDVGQAQILLYWLHQLKIARSIPAIPVYFNSPVAPHLNRIYQVHSGEHRLTPTQRDRMCKAAHAVNTVEKSNALNHLEEPAIIIAADGMATGGRVIHHLKRLAPDARNTILLAAFQAAGTPGAAMIQGARSVRIWGETVPIRAEVAVIGGLSLHADERGILQWLRGFVIAPRCTFITHGEPFAAVALGRRIEEELHWHCVLPDYGHTELLA